MPWYGYLIIGVATAKSILLWFVLAGCVEIAYRDECARLGLTPRPLPWYLRWIVRR